MRGEISLAAFWDLDESTVQFAADLYNPRHTGSSIGEPLALLDPYLTPKSVVLDLACGFGNLAVAIAQRYGSSVLGVDLHVVAISAARRLWAVTTERLDFQIEDVRSEQVSQQIAAADVVIAMAAWGIWGSVAETAGAIATHAASGTLILIDAAPLRRTKSEAASYVDRIDAELRSLPDLMLIDIADTSGSLESGLGYWARRIWLFKRL